MVVTGMGMGCGAIRMWLRRLMVMIVLRMVHIALQISFRAFRWQQGFRIGLAFAVIQAR